MKASRAKHENPDEKKPSIFKSGGFRWLVIVVRDSLKRTMRDAIAFVVIVILAGGGWYYYQSSRPAAVQEKPVSSWIEGKFSGLVSSLEKYHADKGVYPKKLRDAYDVQNISATGLIYRGMSRELVLTETCAATPFSDPCWTGYRTYSLVVKNMKKTYVYSSESGTWEEESGPGSN